jgi:hypothetical protein
VAKELDCQLQKGANNAKEYAWWKEKEKESKRWEAKVKKRLIGRITLSEFVQFVLGVIKHL